MMRLASKRCWRCAGLDMDIARPLVMGILNVTPDSFSDGGLYEDVHAAVARGLEMVAAGADIIDVGGESTRPGSDEVDAEEELARVLPVIRGLAAAGAMVSVDTRHAVVACACVEAGASIINDVSGFSDPAMVELAAGCDAGLIVMHMAGEPKTMQEMPRYDDVVTEVRSYLLRQASQLEAAGVARERICIDPGPGFGKGLQHNAELLEHFCEFVQTGYPVCAAFSRKSCVGAWYGGDKPRDRVWGSVAVAVRAAAQGAAVLRVHDVEQTCAALMAYQSYVSDEGDAANLAAVPDAEGTSPAPVSPLERCAASATAALSEPSKLSCRLRAFVALGSNQGDRLAHLMRAVCKISQLPACEVVEVSPVYESEPAYYDEQPAFANAVLELRCGLLPQVLLAELQRIELEEGRVRSFANAPRPLDLDILDYGGVCSSDPFCILPHPKLLERDFTVTPLLDVAPGHVLADGTPVTREAIAYGAIVGKLGEFDLPLPVRVAAHLAARRAASAASAGGGRNTIEASAFCGTDMHGGDAQSKDLGHAGGRAEAILHAALPLLCGGVACGSTNDGAKRLALQGAADKTVVLAALQTGGRGRLGRTWESPFGGLYHSYVFRPSTTPDKLASFGLVVALGVFEALDELGVQGSGLKWPNDVLLPGGKVAGILLETISTGMASPGGGTALVAGVGINVRRRGDTGFDEAHINEVGNMGGAGGAGCACDDEVRTNDVGSVDGAGSVGDARKEVPLGYSARRLEADSRVESAPPNAAYLCDVLAVSPTLAALAATVVNHVWALYDEWTASGHSFAPFAKRYGERLLTLGKEVCVRRIDGSIEAEGLVEGIDSSGHLLVGGKPVAAGDVTLRTG